MKTLRILHETTIRLRNQWEGLLDAVKLEK